MRVFKVLDSLNQLVHKKYLIFKGISNQAISFGPLAKFQGEGSDMTLPS
jgi:hypothetical protein